MLAVTAMANLRPVEFAVWHIICSLAESEAPAALQASFKFFLIFFKKGIDGFLPFGNITNADGDRRVTNCRRERGGSRRKSAQVEKRSEGPAQTQFATHQG